MSETLKQPNRIHLLRDVKPNDLFCLQDGDKKVLLVISKDLWKDRKGSHRIGKLIELDKRNATISRVLISGSVGEHGIIPDVLIEGAKLCVYPVVSESKQSYGTGEEVRIDVPVIKRNPFKN